MYEAQHSHIVRARFNQPRSKRYDLDALVGLADTADVQAMLVAIAAHFGVDHAAYLALELPQVDRQEPFFMATYSAAWIEHYRARHYVEIDPVLNQTRHAILPQNWRDFQGEDPAIDALFADAAAFGVGNQGITIPLRGPAGETAMFSLAASCSDAAWQGFIQSQLADAQLIAHHVHRAVIRQQGFELKQPLSRREIEVVAWLAAGRTHEDIALILNLSAHTVKTYIRSAKYKLDALNAAHLIAKAVRMKLVRPER